MQIRLDVTTLCAPRPSGVGVYVRQLWAALARRSDVDLRGLWNPSRLVKGRHRYLPPEIAAAADPRWPLLASRSVRRAGALVHGPDFRLPDWSPGPRVVSIHDLASFLPDTMPPDFAALARARVIRLDGAHGPDAVLTGSRAVAVELVERLPALAGRIHAIPYGCDHLSDTRSGSRPDGPPYFLFVGNVERRKNVAGIVAAFNLVAAERPEIRLVVVGKPGFGAAEIEEKLAASPARDRIERRTWVETDQLPGLYAGAHGLVFPTWYEGFGFPILEAMGHGCPVITTSNGTMAEVAGGAALLVDPARPEDIAGAMDRLLDDETLHADLAARGRAHARTFTWDRCAEETAAVYATVLGR